LIPENPMPREAANFGNLSRKKYLFYLLSFVIGLLGIIIVAQSFSDENIWRKDFLEDYLSARAILLGLNPYQPLSELAVIQGYSLPHGMFLHPNPHSPFLVVLSIPFGLFFYKVSACLNVALEICCLVFSVVFLAKWLGLKLTPLTTCAIVWLSFGWGAVWENLALGQTNLTVLALLVVGLWGLTTERYRIGGIAIGCAITLKIIFWPLLVLVAVYRKAKVFTAACATLVALNSAAICVLGYQAIENYYRHVTPAVASYYRAFSGNMSLWSVGWKLFEGTGSHALVGISVPPLVDIPRMAPFISYGLVVLLFCVSLFLSVRVRNIEAAYAVMISFSLLMTPLCWSHYLVVTAIPFAYAARRALDERATVKSRMVLYLTGACLLIPGPILAGLERWFQQYSALDLPLLLLAVSLIPMYGVLSCAFLCYSFSGTGWKMTGWCSGRKGGGLQIHSPLVGEGQGRGGIHGSK
jgi:hypothetical protein